MAYPAYEDCNQIGSVHRAAICKEIGERLRSHLDQEPVQLTPRLSGLIEKLRDDLSRNSQSPSA
jgi:hypothetical protein